MNPFDRLYDSASGHQTRKGAAVNSAAPFGFFMYTIFITSVYKLNYFDFIISFVIFIDFFVYILN